MKMLTGLTVILMLLQLCSATPLPPSVNSRAPCRDRLRQVMAEIRAHGDIVSKPHYVPECDITGRLWTQAQCDHHDVGYCFCVDPNTGAPADGPKYHYHAKESLRCAPTIAPAGDVKLCQLRQAEYRTFRKTWPGAVGNILSYNPECERDGRFKGVQRDSNFFFCVDVVTGEKIPGTDKPHSTDRPLVEFVCQEYSKEWRNYLQWLRTTTIVSAVHTDHAEVVNQTSCKAGFVFKECACALRCEPGTNMSAREAVTECDSCKPVCACPEGHYQFAGECISNADCMAMSSQKHTMIDLKGAVWREYQSDHPNPHIQNYLRGGRGVFSEEGNGIEFAAERSQTTVSAPLENPVYYEEQESTSSSQPPTTASSTEVYEEEEEEEATSETTTEQPEEEEQTTPPPQKKEESEGPLSVSYYTYEYGEDYNETSQEQKQEITTSDENRLWRLLLLGASNEQVGMRSLRQRINDITASLLEIQNRLDSVLEANGGSPARTTAQSRSETDEPTDPFVLPTTGNQGFQAGLDRISTPLRKAIDRRGSPPSN